MNFIIEHRPDQDLPFVVVERIREYQQDLRKFATQQEAESWLEWATYSEAENNRR
jgi:hypothetical protein